MEKFKQNRKFLLGLCALIVVVAMVSVGATLAMTQMFGAYRNTNVFTIGNVDIDLIDEYTQPASVKAGDIVQKKVAVKNIGTVSCYVRVYLKRSWNYGTKANPGADKIVPEVAASGEYLDGEHWVKGVNHHTDDKYKDFECWYYNEVVNVKAETAPLFTQFHLNAASPAAPYNNMIGSITVMAEAVQAKYIGNELIKSAYKNTDGKICDWPTQLNGETLEFKAKEG